MKVSEIQKLKHFIDDTQKFRTKSGKESVSYYRQRLNKLWIMLDEMEKKQ